MRQQEDKIYALEDYLTDYQQLLCNARAENTMLKRQLGEGPICNGEPSDRGAPAEPAPAAAPPPPGAGSPSVKPKVTVPAVPPLDYHAPAVPPPEDQSANEPAGGEQDVQPAAAAIEVVGQRATAVVLRGEVRLDDGASGPRVLVQVEPVAEAGGPAEFHGSLSLLVLDPAAPEKQQQLARWDFEPEELSSQAKPNAQGAVYEFPLQLPAEVPTKRPLELWVRLVPEDGEKLLAQSTLDLSRPGRFASAEVASRQVRPHVTHVAAAELTAEPDRRPAAHTDGVAVRQSGWQTALPGQPAKPQADGKPDSEWKTATRPVPEVEAKPVASSPPPAGDEDRYGAGTGAGVVARAAGRRPKRSRRSAGVVADAVSSLPPPARLAYTRLYGRGGRLNRRRSTSRLERGGRLGGICRAVAGGDRCRRRRRKTPHRPLRDDHAWRAGCRTPLASPAAWSIGAMTPGTRLALLVRPGIEFVTLVFALLRAGR